MAGRAKKKRPATPRKRTRQLGVGSRPRPSPGHKEILDVAGAAEALGFSQKYIRQLARQGKLPGTKFGNSWRFVMSDLIEAVRSGGQIDSIEKVLGRRGVKMTSRKKG